MRDPVMFDACSDDGLGKAGVKKHIRGMLANPSVTMLIPGKGVIVTFVRQNQIMYNLHIAITENCPLNFTERISSARAASAWMINNVGARKFVAQIPEYNRKARMFATKVGLSQTAILTDAFQKKGRFVDLFIFQSKHSDVMSLIKE